MTVEAAFAIASIVVVVALCLGGIGAVTAQIRCIDAAREAALTAARGDTERAVSAGESVAPPRARITLRQSGESVTASVTAPSPVPWVTVSAEATAVKEPE